MTDAEYSFLVQSVAEVRKARPGITYCVMGQKTFEFIKRKKKAIGPKGFLGLGVAVSKSIDTDAVLWFATELDASRFARKIDREIAKGVYTWPELYQALQDNLMPLKRLN